MKIRGFFARGVYVLETYTYRVLLVKIPYKYTLAFTLFQMKRISFRHACENTKLFANALPISIL